MKTTLIVLSKDRASQADLLLKSLYKNLGSFFPAVNIYVLFKASDSYFKKGYFMLRDYWDNHPNIRFVEEWDYYEDVMTLVDNSEYVSFLTDDDILYKETYLPAAIDTLLYESVACFSLRLGLNTHIQDPYIQSETLLPSSGVISLDYGPDVNLLVWNWRDAPPYMNFGYPMSVDGHIFNKNVLFPILKECKFNNPNQQEIAMSAKANLLPELMYSFSHSRLVNTPLNRVQETCLNRAGEQHGLSAEELNNNFIAGRSLNFDSIDFSKIIGCHQELEINYAL